MSILSLLLLIKKCALKVWSRLHKWMCHITWSVGYKHTSKYLSGREQKSTRSKAWFRLSPYFIYPYLPPSAQISTSTIVSSVMSFWSVMSFCCSFQNLFLEYWKFILRSLTHSFRHMTKTFFFVTTFTNNERSKLTGGGGVLLLLFFLNFENYFEE